MTMMNMEANVVESFRGLIPRPKVEANESSEFNERQSTSDNNSTQYPRTGALYYL